MGYSIIVGLLFSICVVPVFANAQCVVFHKIQRSEGCPVGLVKGVYVFDSPKEIKSNFVRFKGIKNPFGYLDSVHDGGFYFALWSNLNRSYRFLFVGAYPVFKFSHVLNQSEVNKDSHVVRRGLSRISNQRIYFRFAAESYKEHGGLFYEHVCAQLPLSSSSGIDNQPIGSKPEASGESGEPPSNYKNTDGERGNYRVVVASKQIQKVEKETINPIVERGLREGRVFFLLLVGVFGFAYFGLRDGDGKSDMSKKKERNENGNP